MYCTVVVLHGRNQYSILRLCKEIVAESAKSLFFFVYLHRLLS